MAIDISPLHDIVHSTIHYEIHDGNCTLLPPGYHQGVVIFTCTGYTRLSGEVITREPAGEGEYRESISWLTLFTYQLDMMRAVELVTQSSPLVPFEMEASSVVNALDYNAPMLADRYGLGISPLQVSFSMELESEIPLHRMTADFTIRALDSTRVTTKGTALQCVDLNITRVAT